MKQVKQRNPIAFDLCTNGLYKNKAFNDKRKMVKRFDIRKELKNYE